MKKRLLVTVVLWTGVVGLAVAQQTSVCLLSPPYLTIEVPVRGVTWLEGEPFDGPCNAIADRGWVRQPADSFDLLVAADGPGGSGRYWTVAVGIAVPGETTPHRGFCLATTTVGWRTLQRFSTPLPWLGDRDSDGRPEVIIWGSFPLREDATLGEYGLMAWVYELNPEGVFIIDWRLSRKIAEEIASGYRSPVAGSAVARFQEMRNDVARYLEEFASEKCKVREQGAR